jgi:hypothetical protein
LQVKLHNPSPTPVPTTPVLVRETSAQPNSDSAMCAFEALALNCDGALVARRWLMMHDLKLKKVWDIIDTEVGTDTH